MKKIVDRVPQQIVTLTIVCLFFILLEKSFFGIENIKSVLYSVSLLAPAAIGMQLLLITGYFDLSIGSVVTLAGVIITVIYKTTNSLAFGIAVGISSSLVLGLLNGLLVVNIRLHCLIATIATASISTAASLIISNGSVIIGLPEGFEYLASGYWLGIPLPILIAITLTIVFSTFCTYSITFRRFYQVGSSTESAILCGIKVNRIICIGFIVSSLCGSLVGILELARTSAASPVSNNALPLELIAACVIGGSSLNGGKGNVSGCIIGLFVMQGIDNIVILRGIELYWRYLAVGIAIIIVAALNKNISTPKL